MCHLLNHECSNAQYLNKGTTQRDNAAMGLLLLIDATYHAHENQLQKELPKQVLFADDAAAGGT